MRSGRFLGIELVNAIQESKQPAATWIMEGWETKSLMPILMTLFRPWIVFVSSFSGFRVLVMVYNECAFTALESKG